MNNDKFLYKKIFYDMITQIKNEKLQPGSKLKTEFELMREYGASRTTIRRALNELSNINLIYRVKKSGTFVNGKPNFNINNPRIVPIILPFNESMQMDTVTTAQIYALEHNAFTPVFDSQSNILNERTILLSLLKKNIDGFVIYPCIGSDNLDLFYRFKQKKIPFCFIDRGLPILDAPLVTTANRQAMYDSVSYLIKCGHRKIAFFALTTLPVYTEEERLIGYFKALEDNRIELNSDYVFNLNDLLLKQNYDNEKSQEEIYFKHVERCIDKLLMLDDRPTAICFVNDMLAINFIRLIKKHNLSVPDDFSIVGFDDIKQARDNSPPLTTCAQNFEQIGHLAVKNILDGGTDCSTVELPAKLIIRKSVKTLD